MLPPLPQPNPTQPPQPPERTVCTLVIMMKIMDGPLSLIASTDYEYVKKINRITGEALYNPR